MEFSRLYIGSLSEERFMLSWRILKVLDLFYVEAHHLKQISLIQLELFAIELLKYA